MNHTLLRNALLVLAAAMVVRVLAVFLLQSHLGTYVIDAYDVMGKNLLAGHGFSYQAGQTVPTVTRAPFYPLWWAGLLEVFGRNFYLLRMAEGFVDAVTAGLVVMLSFSLSRPFLSAGPPQVGNQTDTANIANATAIATVAGAIYAVQPFSVYYAVKMGTETWFTFWLVLALLFFVSWCRRPTYARGALLGSVFGILMLNKSTAAGLLIVLLALGLALLHRRGRLPYVSALVCVAVAALVITPWLARDYRVTGGHFVAIQTLTSWNFWADFDFSARGYTHSIDSHYGRGGGHPYALSAKSDVAQEERLRSQALHWMAAHPAAMLKKMGNNVLEFWYLTEGMRSVQITAAASIIELLAAFAGAWLAWRARNRQLIVLTMLVVTYFDIIYSPLKSVFQYSLVVVPLLCVLQAYLFVWLARHLRGSRSGTPNGVTEAVKRMSG